MRYLIALAAAVIAADLAALVYVGVRWGPAMNEVIRAAF